ncbi:hypothetical protein RG265_001161 [Providencia stuartii]
MLKQSDITQEARIVFEATPYSEEVTAGEVSQVTGLAQPRCQLILTQLAMAGLVEENIKENTYSKYPTVKMGGWWVLVSPYQPFARSERITDKPKPIACVHKATRAYQKRFS